MRSLDAIIVLINLAGGVEGGIFSSSSSTRGDTDEYSPPSGTLKGPLGMIIISLSIAAWFFSGTSLVIYVRSAHTDGITILQGLVSMLVAWLVLHEAHLNWNLPPLRGISPAEIGFHLQMPEFVLDEGRTYVDQDRRSPGGFSP